MLLFLNEAHLDVQILNKHLYSLVVLRTKRNDDVSVLHRWLDEVVVGRFYKAVVLGKHVNDCTATISDVPLN